MRKVAVAMNTSRRKHRIAPIKLSIAAMNSASTGTLMRKLNDSPRNSTTITIDTSSAQIVASEIAMFEQAPARGEIGERLVQLLRALALGLGGELALEIPAPIDRARQAIGEQRQHDADAREQEHRRHGQPDHFPDSLDRRQIADADHYCGVLVRTKWK